MDLLHVIMWSSRRRCRNSGALHAIKYFVFIRKWLFDYLTSASHKEATIFTVTMWLIREARKGVRNDEKLEYHRCCWKRKAFIDTWCRLLVMLDVNLLGLFTNGSHHQKIGIWKNTNASIFGNATKREHDVWMCNPRPDGKFCGCYKPDGHRLGARPSYCHPLR